MRKVDLNDLLEDVRNQEKIMNENNMGSLTELENMDFYEMYKIFDSEDAKHRIKVKEANGLPSFGMAIEQMLHSSEKKD